MKSFNNFIFKDINEFLGGAGHVCDPLAISEQRGGKNTHME